MGRALPADGRTRGALRLAAVVVALTAAAIIPRGARAQEPVQVELFTRPGCPYCERAEAWLESLEARHRVRILRWNVEADRMAGERLARLAAERGIEPVAVPAILVRGRLFVGFDSPATTGAAIERWLTGQRASDATVDTRASPPGGVCEPTDAVCEEEVVHLPLVGEVRPRELGLPLFTLVIGLVDGFNPCAMWVLLFLLSILVHLRDRARMAMIAGTFVLVSGLVYYAFMAAWLELFLLLGISRAVQIGLGVFALVVAAIQVKDFVEPARGPSLSIPASAKPGIYARARAILRAEHLPAALALAAVLAVLVNFVELLCTAGLPALYTQVLATHGLSRADALAYLVLYDVAYMLDDAIMVAIGVLTLSQRKLQARGGRVLKLVSGVVMAALGLVLLFAPERLGALGW